MNWKWMLPTDYETKEKEGKMTYILVACRPSGNFSIDILDIFVSCTCQCRIHCRTCTGKLHFSLYSAGRILFWFIFIFILKMKWFKWKNICCYLCILHRWGRCNDNRKLDHRKPDTILPVVAVRDLFSSWHRQNCQPNNHHRHWHYPEATNLLDLFRNEKNLQMNTNEKHLWCRMNSTCLHFLKVKNWNQNMSHKIRGFKYTFFKKNVSSSKKWYTFFFLFVSKLNKRIFRGHARTCFSPTRL